MRNGTDKDIIEDAFTLAGAHEMRVNRSAAKKGLSLLTWVITIIVIVIIRTKCIKKVSNLLSIFN